MSLVTGHNFHITAASREVKPQKQEFPDYPWIKQGGMSMKDDARSTKQKEAILKDC